MSKDEKRARKVLYAVGREIARTTDEWSAETSARVLRYAQVLLDSGSTSAATRTALKARHIVRMAARVNALRNPAAAHSL